MSDARFTSMPPPAPVEFRYTQTDSVPAVLRELGASLVITTYQANKLLVARAVDDGLSTLVRTFDRPMGLAIRDGRMALGCRNQVWEFRNAPAIAPLVEPAGRHDACFVPRTSHVTGDICVHELAWAGGAGDELWAVNTRFSCLCTLDPDYSFVPRWRPPFVSELLAEDRCHLNGLAVVDGQPKYVTALGESDAANGWRANKPHGGCLMEVRSGEVISRGLSMPHSPRWTSASSVEPTSASSVGPTSASSVGPRDGRLWLLESGTGRLVMIDPVTGQREPVAEVPGFARGLALCGAYAFVGLSKIRATSAMDGVPLAARRDELKCGVAVVDLAAGRVCGMLEFQSAVEEIFDVQLLGGFQFPEVMGFAKDTLHHTFIVPDPTEHVGAPWRAADRFNDLRVAVA
ncbi:MAG TPA: TIGR03032 family protein [Tepidisphaeraceae bacterium]